MREQEVIEIFDNFLAQELEISFQDEVCLETEVDIRYIKTGEEEIKFYINSVAKPDIDEYVEQTLEKSKDEILTYCNDEILPDINLIKSNVENMEQSCAVKLEETRTLKDIAEEKVNSVKIEELLNTSHFSNCILSAPNGVFTHMANNFIIKEGVQLLLADGVEVDGRLKSNRCIFTEDTEFFVGDVVNPNSYLFLYYDENNNLTLKCAVSYIVSNIEPAAINSPIHTCVWYNPEMNKMYFYKYKEVEMGDIVITPWSQPEEPNLILASTSASESEWVPVNGIVLGEIFKPYKAVSLYSDLCNKVNIDGQNFTKNAYLYLADKVMPSTKVMSITLKASGSIYTAPRNGFFSLRKSATAVGQVLQLTNTVSILGTVATSSLPSTYSEIFLPVRKADKIKATYTYGGGNASFSFIYLEGDK